MSGRLVDLAAGTGKLTRLLLPLGDVVAVEVDAVTTAIHRHDPGIAYEKDIDWPAVIGASDRFTPVTVAIYEHEHPMDVELVVDRALSASYVAAGPASARRELAAEIRRILDGFAGTFGFLHVTVVYACSKRS